MGDHPGRDENTGFYQPGEMLSREEHLTAPFTRHWMATGVTIYPENVTQGKSPFFGMTVELGNSKITYAICGDELQLVGFMRQSSTPTMHSPLIDMRRFLLVAAQPEFGFSRGVARIKPRAGVFRAMDAQRLEVAYRRLFGAVELGRDQRGVLWVGRDAQEFRNICAR